MLLKFKDIKTCFLDSEISWIETLLITIIYSYNKLITLLIIIGTVSLNTQGYRSCETHGLLARPLHKHTNDAASCDHLPLPVKEEWPYKAANAQHNCFSPWGWGDWGDFCGSWGDSLQLKLPFFNLDFIQYFCTSLTSKRNLGLCGRVPSCTLNLPFLLFPKWERRVTGELNSFVKKAGPVLCRTCLVNRWNLEAVAWFLVLVLPCTGYVTLIMLWSPSSC